MTKARAKQARILALTPGCPAGIGPEVLVRAISDSKLPANIALWFFASQATLLEGARRARVKVKAVGDDVVVVGTKRVRCVMSNDDDRCVGVKPGVVDDNALAGQRDALVRACEAAMRGEVHAIVTGPTRKKALVVDGIAYPGQTEIVAKYLGDGGEPLMVFAGGPFVLGLVTVHVALAEVPRSITAYRLDRALVLLEDAARTIAGTEHPKLVALGLNPHAGEAGMFGREDDEIVRPALARAVARGIDVAPDARPADGFFADVARDSIDVDGVLAMFHDQGLAPYKLLVEGEGVNVTWGVRVPRTSPDHGTADALAGTGKASAKSMRAALELAARIASPNARNPRKKSSR